MSKNALVLEGGGYRGQFTGGVLDVLMERGFYAFDELFGVSAGALNAAHYKAHQLGRGIRVVLAFRDDDRLMSVASLARTGNLAGNDFLYREVQEEIDPFDIDTFNASPARMWAVATDVMFGSAAYLEVASLPKDIDKIIGSASLPVVSQTVEIDGGLYLDGGFGSSIPVGVALGLDGYELPQGYEPASKALVILTRERTYVRKSGISRPLMQVARRRYADYPYLLKALEGRKELYTHEQELVRQMEDEGRAFVIAPPEPVNIARTERNGEKLLRLYLQGRQQANAHFDELVEFFG